CALGVHERLPARPHDRRRQRRRAEAEPPSPELPRRLRRPREARPLLERERTRHARARPDRERGEGDRARAVRVRAHVSAEARVPRWSARIDAGNLPRGVCLLQICEADVHAESADAAGVPCMTTPAGIESPPRPVVDNNAAGPAAADSAASGAPAAAPPVDEAASLADAVARRRLGERLRRIAPFFADCRRGFVLAFVGAVIAAATEPAIPALLKILLDDGVKQSAISLWAVPIAVIGITFIRGFAGFMSQYGLAWAANRGTQTMRRTMFQRVLDAEPVLFAKNTA